MKHRIVYPIILVSPILKQKLKPERAGLSIPAIDALQKQLTITPAKNRSKEVRYRRPRMELVRLSSARRQ